MCYKGTALYLKKVSVSITCPSHNEAHMYLCLQVDIDEAHWQRNGAGLWHSHKHGFGLMKAWRLVNAAKVGYSVSTSYSPSDIGVALIKQYTHVRNKKSNTKGSSPDMVKVIFHTLRNCS